MSSLLVAAAALVEQQDASTLPSSAIGDPYMNSVFVTTEEEEKKFESSEKSKPTNAQQHQLPNRQQHHGVVKEEQEKSMTPHNGDTSLPPTTKTSLRTTQVPTEKNNKGGHGAKIKWLSRHRGSLSGRGNTIKSTMPMPNTPVSICSKPAAPKHSNKKYRKEYVNERRDVDVLLGRGGRSNYHRGNKRYLQKVEELKGKYKSCSTKHEKTCLSQSVVHYVHSYDGRFLCLDKAVNEWYVVPNEVARKKVSQAFRDDNTPEARAERRSRYKSACASSDDAASNLGDEKESDSNDKVLSSPMDPTSVLEQHQLTNHHIIFSGNNDDGKHQDKDENKPKNSAAKARECDTSSAAGGGAGGSNSSNSSISTGAHCSENENDKSVPTDNAGKTGLNVFIQAIPWETLKERSKKDDEEEAHCLPEGPNTTNSDTKVEPMDSMDAEVNRGAAEDVDNNIGSEHGTPCTPSHYRPDGTVIASKFIVTSPTPSAARRRQIHHGYLSRRKEYIIERTNSDVLLGRGGRANHHIGNKRYLQKVEDLKPKYKSSNTTQEKTEHSQSVVDYVHSYGGRFLCLDKDVDKWYIVSNEVARKKVSQAFRDNNTPEARAEKRIRYKSGDSTNDELQQNRSRGVLSSADSSITGQQQYKDNGGYFSGTDVSATGTGQQQQHKSSSPRVFSIADSSMHRHDKDNGVFPTDDSFLCREKFSKHTHSFVDPVTGKHYKNGVASNPDPSFKGQYHMTANHTTQADSRNGATSAVVNGASSGSDGVGNGSGGVSSSSNNWTDVFLNAAKITEGSTSPAINSTYKPIARDPQASGVVSNKQNVEGPGPHVGAINNNSIWPMIKIASKKRRGHQFAEDAIKTYVEPTHLDVLLGRGGRSNSHKGNKCYLHKVEDLKPQYRNSSTKQEKTILSQSVVDYVRGYNGRFLCLDKDVNKWYIVSNDIARKKVSQAFRDINTPEARAQKRNKYKCGESCGPSSTAGDSVCNISSVITQTEEQKNMGIFSSADSLGQQENVNIISKNPDHSSGVVDVGSCHKNIIADSNYNGGSILTPDFNGNLKKDTKNDLQSTIKSENEPCAVTSKSETMNGVAI